MYTENCLVLCSGTEGSLHVHNLVALYRYMGRSGGGGGGGGVSVVADTSLNLFVRSIDQKG